MNPEATPKEDHRAKLILHSMWRLFHNCSWQVFAISMYFDALSPTVLVAPSIMFITPLRKLAALPSDQPQFMMRRCKRGDLRT